MSPPSESTSSRAASGSILVAWAAAVSLSHLIGLALFDAGEFDDGEMFAESLADALVALLVGHLHAAQVGRDADVVGDEDEQRVGIGVAVVGDGGELGVVLAASVEGLDAAHEEDLEAGHQRRVRARSRISTIGRGSRSNSYRLNSRMPSGTRCWRMASRQVRRKKASSPTKT